MNLWQDVRFAVRMLVKDRWFTLAAATALALGIGANATVFTLVNAVLLRGLPFKEPSRIVALQTQTPRGQQNGVSFEDFQDWRDRSRSFSDLVAILSSTTNISDNDHVPERVEGTYTSWNLFRLIGEQPLLGRDFREEDNRPGAQPVAMLGYGLWHSRYGGDPSVLGRTIRVNSRPVVIVGVMPRGLKFPDNVDLWVPLVALPPASFTGRGGRTFAVIGRLAPQVSLEQARSELSKIGTDLASDYPQTNKDWKPFVQSFDGQASGGPVTLVFMAMSGAVAFVLLIACANVANLLLARSITRSREMAIRSSLGAGRWRIVRQLLVESVLLACLSGVIGLVLAIAGVRWFDGVTQDVDKPYWMEFTFDPIVFAFVAAVCLATGIVFGLAPALHVSKTDVNDVLKENGRGGTGGVAARHWAGALVVVEVVLTVVLLSGAGFMMRSFWNLYQMDLGINTANLLTMEINLPLTKYPEPGPRADIYQQFSDRLAGLPGLQASALATSPPLGGGFRFPLALDGRTPTDGEQPQFVTMVAVSDGYFDTLGLGLRRGRALKRDDGLPGKGAAVVNERFVALHSANVDPLGRQVRLLGGTALDWMSIVGVVPNVRQSSRREPEPDPVIYVPLRASAGRSAVLFVRTPSDVAAVLPSIRDALRLVEADLPLFNVQTMETRLGRARWELWVFGSMFSVFAAIALLLSGLGLFSVTAYSVTQRTQEIGVRMALGAQPRSIGWLVLRRALIQLAIGLPIGIAGAFGVGILLESVLAQVSPRDPVTLISIVVVLTVVAVGACLWPAHRASRFDPMMALRGD